MTRTRDPVPPPTEPFVSPELALVDPDVADHDLRPLDRGRPKPRLQIVESDLREVILRMCELSDVNPPRRTRGIRLLAFSGVATLWLEVVLVAASQGRVGF
jgi:hypothetical protein